MTGDEVITSVEPDAFRWNVRPYQDAPERRFVIFGIALLGGLGGWFLLREPLLGLLGFGMILASTMEYWLGTSYRLDEKGASSRTGFSITAIEWPQIKRVILEEHGLKLSPLASPSRLDAFRGIFLKFDSGNRVQVIDTVRKFGGEYVRSLG